MPARCAASYQERGLETREIHSGQTREEQEDILRQLRNGTLDAIVQVQMLGEGFDHPQLSVAAIFRPFRSLSPYIQFVGRAMRVNVQRAPGHPDNEGIIVSHVGLNIDRHWDDFKAIDRDDQELVHGWLEADDAPPEPREGDGRRRLRPDMVVTEEFIDRFLSDSFLDASEDALIDNAMTVLREQGLDLEALGLTREDLQRRFAAARAAVAGTRASHRSAAGAPEGAAHAPAGADAVRRQPHPRGARRAARRAAHRPARRHRRREQPWRRHRAHAPRCQRASRHRKQRAADQSIDALEQGITALDTIADRVEADLRERLDGAGA